MATLTKQNPAVLHVLRIMAAVAIVTGHWATPYNNNLLAQGQLSIDFFFAIEGYLFARSIGDGSQRSNVFREILRRFLLIYPIYAIGTVAGLAATAPMVASGFEGWNMGLLAKALAFGLGMVPNFTPVSQGAVYPLDWPAWAIVLELMASLVLTLLRRRLNNGVLICGYLFAAAVFLLLAFHSHNVNLGWEQATYWGGFPRVWIGILAGVLVFRLVQAVQARQWKIHPAISLALFGVLIFLPAPGAFFKVASLSLFIGVPTCVFCAAMAEPPAWFTKLGRLSERHTYSVYLLGFPIVIALQQLEQHLGISKALLYSPIGWAFTFAILAAVAHFVTIYWDEPVQGWSFRMLNRRRRWAGYVTD